MRYFVFSSYINAWSIRKGLAKLGKDLLCVAKKTFFLPPITEQPQKGDVLFFTEEDSLAKYFDQREFHFYPRDIPKKIIDDKLAFADYLIAIGEIPIPFSKTVSEPAVYPVLFKSRYSWQEGKKMPSAYLCKQREDYDSFKNDISKQGLKESDFFSQKWLHSKIDCNISVSGFFDAQRQERNIFLISKKILADRKGKLATGTIIEAIADPQNLLQRTKNILMNINYLGPFELEFFHEENDDSFYVVELNPRFWMQHGIFISFFDNAIIKRYLDLDEPHNCESTENKILKVSWFDGLFFLSSLYHFRWQVLRYLLKYFFTRYRICFYPDIFSAMRLLVKTRIKKKTT
jgi:hypothetical protein